MKNVLRLTLGVLAILAMATAGGNVQAVAKKKATVTIINSSDWDIFHFFLSSADDDDWGPDQLGKQVVGKGESFKLTDIPCDSYDVRLIDEDDDECIVEEVDICGGNDRWEITSKDLLKCQAGGR